ncbi:MAG TPA: hypothetical protein VNK26_02515 [Pyrinomonadaceae bacterium]|nr:hypothetical protein [Pyrinomonadaceae bacterium]
MNNIDYMTDNERFSVGDCLIFQLESAYGLLKIIGIENYDNQPLWHISAFSDFFPDVESAESALENISVMKREIRHIALTNRAFLSTQLAVIANKPVTEEEVGLISEWRADPERKVSDRSIRLHLGLR